MPSRILGWAPSQQDGEEVDVNSHSSAVLTFNVAPTQSLESSQSSGSYYFQDTTNDDARPSKKGDPSWVARPRNAFIIFRCEYCREHARGAQPPGDGKSTSPSHNDKTLSKRAGEAWRSLPASQKKHFKELAEKEKLEHAKAHPGYRYRPTKRSPFEKRRRRGQHSGSADARSESRGSSIEGASPAAQVHDFVPSYDESSQISKRRSSSVPLDLLDPSSLFLSAEERDELKRSKSVNDSGATNSPSQYSQLPGYVDTQNIRPDLVEIADNISTYSPVLPATSGNTAADYQAYHISQPTGVSSSLAGWNGEPMPPSLSRVPSSSMTSLSSWTESAASSSVSSPALMSQPPQYAVYQGQAYAGLSRPQPQYILAANSSPMLTQPQALYWQNAAGLQGYAGYPRAQYQLDDAARAYALQDYGVGLHAQRMPHGENMTFDMKPSEEQALFDGFCRF